MNATTGSWNLAGGTLLNGTLTESGGAELFFTNQGGTLDGITTTGNLDLASNNGAQVNVQDGLTLNNATILVGNAAGSTYGTLYFTNTETLGGSGTVLFGKHGSNALYADGSSTLTVGSGMTVRGSNGTLSQNYPYTATVINQGTLQADDSGGQVSGWSYYTGFSGSYTGNTAAAIDASGVSKRSPQAVYQTWRTYNNFSYTLGGLTAGQSYTVRLHFAEPTYNQAGQRVFNVSLNGSQVLGNFDIYATVGAMDKAVVESFTAQADSSGTITVQFSEVSGDWALVNGIEVQSGGSDAPAINAGELAGGTLSANVGTFTNSGTLAVSNGAALNINGLSGNLGKATLSGSGTPRAWR